MRLVRTIIAGRYPISEMRKEYFFHRVSLKVKYMLGGMITTDAKRIVILTSSSPSEEKFNPQNIPIAQTIDNIIVALINKRWTDLNFGIFAKMYVVSTAVNTEKGVRR